MTTPLLRVLFDSASLRVSTAGQGIAGSGVEDKLGSTVVIPLSKMIPVHVKEFEWQ
jgi:hypothetical protein